MFAHAPSPPAVADPGCDICGLYAFPSPERPGNLVLVMTLARRAVSTAFFSDSIVCRFRLRPVAIAGVGPRARFAPARDDSELVIDCTFTRPSSLSSPSSGGELLVQEGRCATRANQHVASVTVHDRRGRMAQGLRMFAGLVSDPFIFQFESLFKTIATGRMAFQAEAKNSLDGANVLGLVVEIERATWLTGGPLFGVIGETLATGKGAARMERLGRPEIKNIGLQWRRRDTPGRHIDLGSLYDKEDAFDVAAPNIGAYRARLNANLRFFDGLDGKVDWPSDEEGNHPLVGLLLGDYLVVDVSKPFTEVSSYLEIERAMLGGHPHQTCGGRTLNDDCLDTTYTLLINAGKGPRITDGVDHATVAASGVFPYLAPPNPLQARVRPGAGARTGEGRAAG